MTTPPIDITAVPSTPTGMFAAPVFGAELTALAGAVPLSDAIAVPAIPIPTPATTSTGATP